MDLVTVDELARWLRVKPSWVYERTRSRGQDRIPHFRLGKYVRFDPSSPAFQAWLAAHGAISLDRDHSTTIA
jgi:hypothetical protein